VFLRQISVIPILTPIAAASGGPPAAAPAPSGDFTFRSIYPGPPAQPSAAGQVPGNSHQKR
jgi:hypothetical protein